MNPVIPPKAIDSIPSQYDGRATFSLAEVVSMMPTSMNTLRRSIDSGEVKTIRVSKRRKAISRAELTRILTEGLGA